MTCQFIAGPYCSIWRLKGISAVHWRSLNSTQLPYQVFSLLLPRKSYMKCYNLAVWNALKIIKITLFILYPVNLFCVGSNMTLDNDSELVPPPLSNECGVTSHFKFSCCPLRYCVISRPKKEKWTGRAECFRKNKQNTFKATLSTMPSSRNPIWISLMLRIKMH